MSITINQQIPYKGWVHPHRFSTTAFQHQQRGQKLIYLVVAMVSKISERRRLWIAVLLAIKLALLFLYIVVDMLRFVMVIKVGYSLILD